jgi:spectrin alpha
MEIWLSEMEGQLLSEDYGKDLTSVQNLQKKHQLLESDIGSHTDRIEEIKAQSANFVEAEHFDANNIDDKMKQVVDRYENLQVGIF